MRERPTTLSTLNIRGRNNTCNNGQIFNVHRGMDSGRQKERERERSGKPNYDGQRDWRQKVAINLKSGIVNAVGNIKLSFRFHVVQAHKSLKKNAPPINNEGE